MPFSGDGFVSIIGYINYYRFIDGDDKCKYKSLDYWLIIVTFIWLNGDLISCGKEHALVVNRQLKTNMTKDLIYNAIGSHALAVVCTVAVTGKPESALVGFAISEDLEIIFDTVTTSRKYQNILQNPQVAVVIGWDNETTIQLEGKAIVLNGADDEKLRECYFNAFNDARQRAATWPNLVHVKIIPTWIRYSNFNSPQVIVEMEAPFV